MKNKLSRSAALPPGWKIPEQILQRIGRNAGKQRVIAEADTVLIVLHHVPQLNQTQRESLFVFRDTNGTWDASEHGNGISAMESLLEDYSKLYDQLEAKYDKAKRAKDFFLLLEHIAPVQRAMFNLSKTLQTAREIVGYEMIDLRDKSEELARNFELLHTDGKNGLEYAIAKRSEEQAELQQQALASSHRLNMLMALFLPITAVASILGMNVPHGLEKSSYDVFFKLVALLLSMGGIVLYIILRKPKC